MAASVSVVVFVVIGLISWAAIAGYHAGAITSARKMLTNCFL
jgi:hypothetical protein